MALRWLLPALLAVSMLALSAFSLERTEDSTERIDLCASAWPTVRDAAFLQAVINVSTSAPCDGTAAHSGEWPFNTFQQLVQCYRDTADNGKLPHLDQADKRIVGLLEATAAAFPPWLASENNNDEAALDVVIVGAGPACLLSALQIRELPRSQIRSVTVLERRTAYTRDAWVDISTTTNGWYYGLRRLKRWGGTLLEADQHWFSPTHVMFRTNMLERALLRLVLLAGGIRVACETEPVIICPPLSDASRSSVVVRPINGGSQIDVCASAATENGQERLEFDLLLGCEGNSGSWLREQAELGTTLHDTAIFETQTGPLHVRLPALEQLTMIVRFAVNSSTSECPELKNKGEINPYDIGFSHANVTAAFKRWYKGHCQLQLVFKHAYANDLLAKQTAAIERYGEAQGKWQRAGLPWRMLLSVSNEIFSYPFDNVTQLLHSISPRSISPVSAFATDGNNNNNANASVELDVDLLPIRIRSTNTLAKALHNNRSMVAVFGDNAVTAHYRLGIGINQAFNALDELRQTLDDVHLAKLRSFSPAQTRHSNANSHANAKQKPVSPSLSLVAAADKQNTRASARAKAMIQIEVQTIVLEAYCGFTVGFDFEQRSFWQSHRAVFANPQTRDYDQLGQAAGGRWAEVVLQCLRRLALNASASELVTAPANGDRVRDEL